MLKNTTILFLLSLLSACSTFHVERELEVSSEMEDLRPIQTRWFHTSDQAQLTTAMVDTLLELGFSDIQHESSLGFASASFRTDEFDADEVLQIGAMFFVAILLPGINFGNGVSVDDYEMLYATVTTMPGDNTGTRVRLTLQRVMRAINKRISNIENVDKADVYAEFFKRMQSKLPGDVAVLQELQ